MKFYKLVLITGSMLFKSAIAQEIAIIDQGLNTLETNNGAFYNPICLSAGNKIFSDGSNFMAPDDLSGTKVVITQASLCRTSPHFGVGFSNTANVPRTWSFNDLNSNNQPFQEVGMAVLPQANSPRHHYFSAHLKT